MGLRGSRCGGSTLWASYAIDLAAAWTLGIVFQYFSIKPMRKLTAGAALVAAIKADTLSIVAFQVGMYGWMAVVYFVLFPGPHLTPFEPVYWPDDADRDGDWICDGVSDEPGPGEDGVEGGDVA